MKKLILYIAAALAGFAVICGGCAAEDGGVSLASPDGSLTAEIYLEDGAPRYSVSLDGREIISRSALGLVCGTDLSSGLTVTDTRFGYIDETYPMVTGKAAEYHNECNTAEIDFSKDGTAITLYLRCYDDGFAFAYSLADGGTVYDEATEFCLPSDCTVYAIEYEDCYESLFKTTTLGALNGVYGTPFLINEGGTYVLIGEANLTSAYCGSALSADGGTALALDFEPKQTEPVYMTAGAVTPWRVIAVGSAAEIADTEIFENLCPPCEIEDTSWIVPGVSAWTWFNGDATDDPETYKSYVDLAAEMGWEYILLDEGWQPRAADWTEDKKTYEGAYDWTAELIGYAAGKGIGVFVWSTYWDLDTAQKRERLAEWANMGIKGVKIDFFNSETQDMLPLYETLTKECADLRLMVNFHGCVKPTGLRRTYPNLVTCEAVYGTEHFRSGEGWGATAEHNCILPFTRNAAGPMDFTPAITDYYGKSYFTDAQKAALPIVFESGVQTLSDKPDRYRESPYYELLKDIPTAWDETKTLDAEPGKYVVTARRSGDTYYIGSICAAQHTEDVDLSFLDSGIWRCEIYTDYGTTVRAVTAADVITLPQTENGGAAVKLTKWTGDYFTDTATHWCAQYLDSIDGYFYGEFKPDTAITRAEFVTMLLTAYGTEIEVGTPAFYDAQNVLLKNQIYTAAASGIVNGTSDTEFSPDALITREQAATIIGRFKNMDSEPAKFSDNADISAYALGYVGACEKAGIITGYEDGTFRPQNNITRAEAAAMLARSR